MVSVLPHRPSIPFGPTDANAGVHFKLSTRSCQAVDSLKHATHPFIGELSSLPELHSAPDMSELSREDTSYEWLRQMEAEPIEIMERAIPVDLPGAIPQIHRRPRTPVAIVEPRGNWWSRLFDRFKRFFGLKWLKFGKR